MMDWLNKFTNLPLKENKITIKRNKQWLYPLI